MIKNLKEFLSSDLINTDCLKMETLFETYKTFEEIPLIDRYGKIKNWKRKLAKEDMLPIWINICNFIISTSAALDKTSKKSRFCITFCNFEETIEESYIPNIHISSSYLFLSSLKEKLIAPQESKQPTLIERNFLKCDLLKEYDFYQSSFYDHSTREDITRIYCFKNQNTS